MGLRFSSQICRMVSPEEKSSTYLLSHRDSHARKLPSLASYSPGQELPQLQTLEMDTQSNCKFHWDYNHLYDLYYQAGVPLERQRVASPFISQALSSLKLYRAIDPDTWGKMINRVNGVNFTGLYGGTSAMGWQSITLPENMTWSSYFKFLLCTLPEEARENYLHKLSVSMEFWRNKGGCLAEETIAKLRRMGIPITVSETTNYKTDKKPVRMDYQDDVRIPEFKELPTFKRICICILKNDHACKYMGFAPSKAERERRAKVMQKYKSIMESYGRI